MSLYPQKQVDREVQEMLAHARQHGLWFFYETIALSPWELEQARARDVYKNWGRAYWELRRPETLIEAEEEKIRQAERAIGDLRDRMEGKPAGYTRLLAQGFHLQEPERHLDPRALLDAARQPATATEWLDLQVSPRTQQMIDNLVAASEYLQKMTLRGMIRQEDWDKYPDLAPPPLQPIQIYQHPYGQ